MATSPLVAIHERRPYWAPILQREFQESLEFTVRSMPHWIDLRAQVAGINILACICAMDEEFSADAIPVLADLANATALIVVATRLASPLEWRLREVGAASILESSIPVSHMVRALRRRLQYRSGP